MKQFLGFALCLFISGSMLAQKGASFAKKNPNKSAIAGIILNMRKQPVSGVKAFVYKKDSIAASGFTDSAGYFETNFVVPGIYDLKLVYPSEKMVVITAVPVKARTITMTNLKMADPAADSTVSYATIAPQKPQPVKGKKL